MKRRVANCPACGGPVEFQLSTALVTVCDFCHSVVARTDKKLEDHGKVADLVETNSPLRRGMIGTFAGKNYEVVGRVQYRHPAGGVWDEWYLKFPNDRVKWLAHAQGKFYLTTEKRLTEGASLPTFDSLSPGESFDFPGAKKLVVAERGVATAASASGEIPWAFRPNAEHRFVDLHGVAGGFATIEYEDTGPRVFFGREVSLKELGLVVDSWESTMEPVPNTTALQINCPQCAGPLTLHPPDQTMRVCCPSCKSLLDCQQGKLQYLETLQMKRGEKPLIPLGSVGTLSGVEYTVIGFMERFVVEEGKKYYWTEYLLFNQGIGFRWLVRSKGHWSFVEPVPVSSVTSTPERVVYQDQQFFLFDRGIAYVKYVIGEFYWRVTVGEQVEMADYISPPCMLSFERSNNEAGSELNISLGTYLDKSIIEAAFKLKELPAPWGIGAIQPTPPLDGTIISMWGLFAVILLGLNIVFSSGILAKPFGQLHFFLPLIAISIWPIISVVSNWGFNSKRWEESNFQKP